MTEHTPEKVAELVEQSIRDELAEAMIGVKSADGRAWFIFGDNEDDRADTLVLADAILASPVIRRIQAEAWDAGYVDGATDGFNRSQGNTKPNPYRGETA